MRDNPPSVGALIVTWNRVDDVLECIDSIFATEYPRLLVYVVDNASTDDTVQQISRRFPDVRLIRSEENQGFASGNNLGLSWVIEEELDAAFLINDDAVVKKDCLEKLVDAAWSAQNIGVAAPKITLHSAPEIIWSAGGTINQETGVAAQRFYGEADGGQAGKSTEIDYAVGCAMLVKIEAIRRVGMLDPRFFTYYEEADWCRRIRSEGYRVVYVPEGVVTHKVTLESNGRNQASYYYSRNRLLYLDSAGLSKSRIAWIAATDLLRSAVAHTVKGRRRQGRLIAKGVADYYSNRFGRMSEKHSLS